MGIRRTLYWLLLIAPQLALAGTTQRVLLISVDGLHAGRLGELVSTDTNGDYANFERLMSEGSYTLNARTDVEYTNTMPNHTSMVTGRPVTQPPGQPDTTHHGYTWNSNPDPDDTYHNSGNPNLSYIASVFDVVHDHGLSTAAYVSKSKFSIVQTSYDAAHGAPDVTGTDDGTAKIDSYVFDGDTASLSSQVVNDLSTTPRNFYFVHFRDPDSAGHADGWGSLSWDASVAFVDDHLGEILGAIDASPSLTASTAIILTADHGGAGTGHADAQNPENYTIPFFVWGSDVAIGGDLYAFNVGSRLDPVTDQRSYNAFPQPIRNGDAANLALALLELPAISGSSINAAQDLRVAPGATAAPAQPSALRLTITPNPFNPRTEAVFVLERSSSVALALFDASGRLVRSWPRHELPAGRHRVSIDGRGLSSGSYHLRLESDDHVLSHKLVLLK